MNPKHKALIKASDKGWERLESAHKAMTNPKSVAKHKEVEENRRAEFLHKNKAKVMGGLHGKINYNK